MNIALLIQIVLIFIYIGFLIIDSNESWFYTVSFFIISIILWTVFCWITSIIWIINSINKQRLEPVNFAIVYGLITILSLIFTPRSYLSSNNS